MTMRLGQACLLLLWSVAYPLVSEAQQKQRPPINPLIPEEVLKAKPPADLVTKVYPVGDLVFAAPNYPFEGLQSSEAFGRAAQGGGFGGGGGGFGGGGFGGGGGGGNRGGGLFSVPPAGGRAQVAQARPVEFLAQFGGGGMGTAAGGQSSGREGQFTIEQLTEAIVTSIDPNSWTQNGGAGTIVALGGRLIVTQSAQVHKQIEGLLNALRTPGGARSTVTVRAWWLQLDEAGYQKLISETAPASPPLVNRKQLAAMAGEPGADFGEITCFDSQTVHIISGRFRNVVTSVIPVVGQIDQRGPALERTRELAAAPSLAADQLVADVVGHRRISEIRAAAALSSLLLAQAPAAPDGQATPLRNEAAGVGYQPVMTTQHAGALLELTPTRLPQKEGIVLNLKCFVAQWDDQPQKVDFRNVVALDQTKTVMQQMATTLKLPLRKPVLVGAMTLQPGAAAAGGQLRMHLVVEAVDETAAADSRHESDPK